MKKEPDFYLVSTEYIPSIGPLECYIQNVLKIDEVSYFKITISPGIYGEIDDIKTVIIGPRYVGDTLIYPKWPVYVNVFLAKDSVLYNNIKDLSDLKIIAWAEIYKSKADSLKALC